MSAAATGSSALQIDTSKNNLPPFIVLITFHKLNLILFLEAKALAEKQMNEAMAMAQGKCVLQ